MQGCTKRRSTQKAFIEAAGQGRGNGGPPPPPVIYEYPGLFRSNGITAQVNLERDSGFLERLSPALSLADYDRLVRAVWVTHLRASGNGTAASAQAEPAEPPA